MDEDEDEDEDEDKDADESNTDADDTDAMLHNDTVTLYTKSSCGSDSDILTDF